MDLFHYITPQTTTLTPNRRLSAALLKKYSAWQIDQGQSSWLTLDCLPLYPSWLERIWKDFLACDMTETSTLLTVSQEQIIWENILRNAPENDYLLQISATAKLAKSAWETLKRWRVKLNEPLLSLTDDSRAFLQWAQKFISRCTEQHWLDHNSLADHIAEKINANRILPPPHIILLGFTEIAPQYQNLLAICKHKGSEILYYKMPSRNQTTHQVKVLDSETEILTMARFAKMALSTSSSIGCVVPNLEVHREQVLKIFADIFPERNFNISAGKTLSTYPIIETALHLLKIKSNNISLTSLSQLLRTPFIGEAEIEQNKRAIYDNRLRNSIVTSLSLAELTEPQGKFNLTTLCPALAKRLEEFAKQENNTYHKILSFKEWTPIFLDLLNTLGWPGERSLNSHEYQVVQNSWLPLLNEFMNLDRVIEPQNYATALQYLNCLAANTVFQPESPEASVQVLGLLEAAEIPFEHLWIMGLDDTTWPSRPKPNPFIPLRLQKKLNMPNASAERELIYCQELTLQLQSSASHVIFSYPAQRDDAELRPSFLLKSFPSLTSESLVLSPYTSPAEQIFQTRQVEIVENDAGPPITADEVIYGGVSIFKKQAECPFKAFAELRLHAKQIEENTLGLKPIDRGNLIHKALELIWQQLENSSNLHTLTDEALKNLIQDRATKAMRELLPAPSEKNRRYLDLELHRLENLIWNWLQLEKTRPPFKVIAQELEVIANIGNITANMRIDRIDELADGTQLIIDYKTGKNNDYKKWFGARPEEPQLPLYCITNPSTAIGIVFAQIHPSEMNFFGISKTPIHIKSVKTLAEIKQADAMLWDEQTKLWQIHLTELSENFFRGEAEVDPKDSNLTCRQCHLQPLCRIHEHNAAMMDLENDD